MYLAVLMSSLSTLTVSTYNSTITQRNFLLLLVLCTLGALLSSRCWIGSPSYAVRSQTWNSDSYQDTLTAGNRCHPVTMSMISKNNSQHDTKDSSNLSIRTEEKNTNTTTKSAPILTLSPKPLLCKSNFRKEYMEGKNFLCCTAIGGLGNNMFVYASAYGIASHLNRTLLIDKENKFDKYFNITAKTMDDYQCVTQGTKRRRAKYDCGFDKRLMEIPKGDNCYIGAYLQSYKYFEHVEEDIRRQFTFRKEYRDKALTIVEKAVQTHNRRLNRTGQRPTLVGVHVRRGDFVNHTYGYDVASPQYLDNATRYFRNKYENVLFLVCSNDMKWSKKHVRGDDVIYIEKNHFSLDMAVLVSCDHTLSTVGTFGWWVGFLTGGETVYYQWPALEGTRLRKQFSKDFSDFFPSTWIGMR